MKNITVKVDGMTCGGCQAAVEKAIASLAGVASAKVSLEAGAAEVDFDETALGPEEIGKAVEEAGFTVG